MFNDIDGIGSLNKRGHETKKIIDRLKLIDNHPDGEQQLYQCTACGQYWQRSLNWIKGNRAYIFKVPAITNEEWMVTSFVQPDKLFSRSGRIRQYLEGAIFEEKPEKCRKDNCNDRAIKLSVLCALHHMESIGISSKITENNKWFKPYYKHDFEFGIEALKKLPNYKSLK